tara:strand:- start:29465 stop:30238 length:774 start_codon:yes stop_codon:yes gene_type:complete
MRRVFLTTAILAAATALAGCVIVVSDDGEEGKLRHSEHSLNGYTMLDREGGYSRIGGDMNLRGHIGGDLSLVSGDVDASQLVVDGDVSIAGGNIQYVGEIGGDASVAGGHIDWNANVGRELSLAAGSLTVRGQISGRASIAAADLTSEADYARGLRAQGSEIHLGGSVSGPLQLVSAGDRHHNRSYRNNQGRIEIAGIVNDGGQVCTRTLTILSGARISGDLQVWAESAPVIEGDVSAANITYLARDGRDCDDLIDD